MFTNRGIANNFSVLTSRYVDMMIGLFSYTRFVKLANTTLGYIHVTWSFFANLQLDLLIVPSDFCNLRLYSRNVEFAIYNPGLVFHFELG